MPKFLLTYLATGVSFAALDFVWLTQAGPRVYRPALDSVLAAQPSLPAAVVFYLFYIAGVVALAIWPYRETGVGRIAAAGAMLGAVAYATYDLTNQATLAVWQTRITLIDVAWGTFATAAGSAVGGWVWRRLARA